VSEFVVTLTERQARLLLALLEHAANEHAEAVVSQDWDWLDDLFGATFDELEGARAALNSARPWLYFIGAGLWVFYAAIEDCRCSCDD
jgi:hypothetical protein